MYAFHDAIWAPDQAHLRAILKESCPYRKCHDGIRDRLEGAPNFQRGHCANEEFSRG